MGWKNYVLSALSTDFSQNQQGQLDTVLRKVEDIEKSQLDLYEWEGDGFTHLITRSGVRFEHTVFGECPGWPIWYCTFAQYKAALKGYRQFLDMPKSLDSELIVELPDGAPETS